MSGLLSTVGVGEESAWGTKVTPTRWFELVSEGVKIDPRRIDAAGMRGVRWKRQDRSVPWIAGAGGDLNLELLSRGLGLLFKHMLGAVSTTGPTDSAYSHVFTIGTLLGKGLTYQARLPYDLDSAVAPKTAWGGKITAWEIACQAGGAVTIKLTFDFKAGDHSTAATSVTYTTSPELLTFVSGSLSIASQAVPVKSWRVAGINPVKPDLYYIGGSKGEQDEIAARSITWACELNWSDLTQQNRVLSATAAGMYAQIDIATSGLVNIGAGSTKPSLTISLPYARFDDGTPTVGGPDLITQPLSGEAHGSDSSPIILTYVTADATP